MMVLKLTDEKKEIIKKIILIFIATIFIEVIVFNITSYRVLLGNFEKEEIENFEVLKAEDGYTFLEFKNINKKVRNNWSFT